MGKLKREDYPRPDFIREKMQLLNGEWEFTFDYQNVFEEVKDFFHMEFMHRIQVPFCYESKMSGVEYQEDAGKKCPVVWYRKIFSRESLPAYGSRLLLNFGAVDEECKVWLNGEYLGGHKGGYTPFQFDITTKLDKENTLIIKVSDPPNVDKPRGKQTWKGENFTCWYHPVTGIWQQVWLECAGETFLKSVKMTPDVSTMTALCEVELSDDKKTSVHIAVSKDEDGRELICSQTIVCKQAYGKASFAFRDCDFEEELFLWAPEHPNLLYVTIKVGSGAKEDIVSSYFGMRSISVCQGVFMLNGKRYFQRLVLDQGYWEESLLTPPDGSAFKRDILLAKEMGFNGVRKHQKIEDPRFYYWADILGLLVWGELPSAYEYNSRSVETMVSITAEFIKRDFNHPSIVVWVPLNESWGVQNIGTSRQQQYYAEMLYFLFKSLDPSRIVNTNDGWEQVEATDIVGIHDYSIRKENAHKYKELDVRWDKVFAAERRLVAGGNKWNPECAVMLTEFGGIALEDAENVNWGYFGKAEGAEEFYDRIIPVVKAIENDDRFSGFCYTQFADVFQETNGLLTMDRVPKFHLEKLKEIFGSKM